MRRVAAFFFLLTILAIRAATQEVGTLTAMEGGLRLIRGVMVMEAVEGMRLRQGDILESSDQGFDQLEFTDGTVVALGPSSRVFLLRCAPGRASSADTPTAEILLLNGWLKGETKAGAFRYSSPLVGAATLGSTINLHSEQDVASVFVESGSVLIGEVNLETNWKKVDTGKAGQFFSRTAGGAISTSSKPTSTFVSSMPQAFRDTLPSRVSRFSGKSVQPVRQREATFSDLLPWFSIGRPWRMSLVHRFGSLSGNPAFRAAMEGHLKEFPEWDPVLHPRKNPETSATLNSKSGSDNK
jgi:hypothetical protein